MRFARTSTEALRQLLDAPEDATLEFKEAKASYDFDKLAEYCVALANEGGGKILLGVTDKRPRRIVGTSLFAEPGHAESRLHDRLGQRVAIEEVLLPEGRVLIVHVPARLPGSAWQIDGRYLRRAGDALVAIADRELREMFAEIGPDFSAELCPGAALGDLAPEAIAAFRKRWATKSRDERKASWTDTEVLTNAELLVDGRPTYAALILCGKRQALGRHLAQAELIFEYRSSEASGPAADRENFREGFLLWWEAIWARINLRNDRQSYQDGLFRNDVPTFDEAAVREALLNAIAHRDYRLGGSIFVRQFPTRLEVVSPGGLLAGITPDNILERHQPRNRRLAEALERAGFVERAGQGMNLIFESAIRQGKPRPSFAGTTPHEVRLTLDGVMKHPTFVRFLERLGAETLKSFSTYDFMALDAIAREETLPDALRARVPGLVAVGAVESIGRGRGIRYILSRALHEAIGARGTYTRKKGLDHETNKALLLRHVRERGTEGAPFAELEQVLPAVSRRQLQRLMQELRTEGLVRLQGRTKAARWCRV